MVFRENFHHCPSCGATLRETDSLGHRFERCAACSGIWIEPEVLSCMLNDMTPQLTLSFGSFPHSLGPDRGCPNCQAKMERVLLFNVGVDRCARHGVWLDHKELQTALERAATPHELKELFDAWPKAEE